MLSVLKSLRKQLRLRLSGIKQQTLLVALIPILVTTLLFGTYALYTRISDADSALLKQSKSITHQLALTSEYALFSGSTALQEKAVRTQLEHPEILSIQILDANGIPLITEQINDYLPPAQALNVNTDNPVFHDPHRLVLYEPVYATQLSLDDATAANGIAQEKYLGAVVIEFSKNELNQKKLDMLLINLAFMAGVLFISIASALWLSRRITNPILNIGDAIKKIGSGDLVARIPPQTSVLELNELSHDINDMARLLRNHRDTLEQRILSATFDLRARRDEAELAHREVLSLNQKLSLAFIALESKEKAKTRFLAAAGHDLRQPVAAANLFVEALKHSAPNANQVELINKLDQSMSVFSAMLERLLDISKLDAGLIKPDIKAINLQELFNWLDQTFAQAAKDRSLNFRLFYPTTKIPVIRTDIGLLQSIMMNVVSNAIKYTNHGSILISARLRGDKLLLQVWDTGIGIPQHELSPIFDEFYQVGNQHRNREGGLGLGLSICQRATALLGSQISCRSQPGKGSVFEFCLPLHDAHHEATWLPTVSQPVLMTIEKLFSAKRVVVVEDDALVSAGMVTLLQGLGALVQQFDNTDEALRHPTLDYADFFIVDYSLGGDLSGLGFLTKVQEQRSTPFRAVVITGETSSQFIHSIENSAWPVLHKPVNFSKLIAALN